MPTSSKDSSLTTSGRYPRIRKCCLLSKGEWGVVHNAYSPHNTIFDLTRAGDGFVSRSFFFLYWFADF